jgi:hypothetical protein
MHGVFPNITIEKTVTAIDSFGYSLCFLLRFLQIDNLTICIAFWENG